MRKSNLEELMGALETIRIEQHPEVPKELLEALLLLEYENQDSRTEGQSKTMTILDDFLNKMID